MLFATTVLGMLVCCVTVLDGLNFLSFQHMVLWKISASLSIAGTMFLIIALAENLSTNALNLNASHFGRFLKHICRCSVALWGICLIFRYKLINLPNSMILSHLLLAFSLFILGGLFLYEVGRCYAMSNSISVSTNSATRTKSIIMHLFLLYAVSFCGSMLVTFICALPFYSAAVAFAGMRNYVIGLSLFSLSGVLLMAKSLLLSGANTKLLLANWLLPLFPLSFTCMYITLPLQHGKYGMIFPDVGLVGYVVFGFLPLLGGIGYFISYLLFRYGVKHIWKYKRYGGVN